MSDIVDMPTDDNVDKVTVIVDKAPEAEDAPNVIVVNSDSDSGLSADAALAIGKDLAELSARVSAVESIAYEAKGSAEVAMAIAESSSVPEPEITAEPEIIVDPPEAEPESSEKEETIKPQREHWLWKNPRKGFLGFGGKRDG